MLNSLRIFVECNSSGEEFHTLVPMKDVDFKPKFVVLLSGTTSFLVRLKFFTLRTTNKSLNIYSGSMPFTALKISIYKVAQSLAILYIVDHLIPVALFL